MPTLKLIGPLESIMMYDDVDFPFVGSFSPVRVGKGREFETSLLVGDREIGGPGQVA